MPHCAARSGVVIHLMNLNAASCCGRRGLLEDVEVAAAGGRAARLPAGSMATPKSNLALVRTLVRLPVVVHIIATFFSKKSFGVVPHSTMPAGAPCACCQVDPVLQRLDHLRVVVR
jgi:hypothetical protein